MKTYRAWAIAEGIKYDMVKPEVEFVTLDDYEALLLRLGKLQALRFKLEPFNEFIKEKDNGCDMGDEIGQREF